MISLQRYIMIFLPLYMACWAMLVVVYPHTIEYNTEKIRSRMDALSYISIGTIANKNSDSTKPQSIPNPIDSTTPKLTTKTTKMPAKPVTLDPTMKPPITSNKEKNDSEESLFKHFSATNSEEIELLPLSAYLEKSIDYFLDSDNKEEFGKAISPMPLRIQSPSDLTKFSYDSVQSCKDLPHRFPTTPYRTKNNDNGKKKYYTNVHNEDPIEDPLETAPFCPVDADPFLPWIHDVFPSEDGTKIHFIAQNKRRCNQGKRFTVEKERLIPQVSIMQPIALKRLTETDLIPPPMWKPSDNNVYEINETRYRLSSMEEADPDAKETRFLCRFKAVYAGNKVKYLETTPSTYPFNYEYANRLKGENSMLSRSGFDKGSFWLSNFQFDCPLPKSIPPSLLQSESHIVPDTQIPRLYVDVIPVRSGPRVGKEEDGLLLSLLDNALFKFNVKKRWGDHHVLPLIDASGRWENIPICSIPKPAGKTSDIAMIKSMHEKKIEALEEANSEVDDAEVTSLNRNLEFEFTEEKPHYLVGCLWASASYRTRGNQVRVYDTVERLVEWLEFHFMVGFDHVYIYDNTAAHFDPNDTSPKDSEDLSFITDLFPDKVTRIEWPFPVCNNNIPAHENTGERSSQYAAESSCRARFGPYTEWMASFDTDEYFIPRGNYQNLKDLLRDIKEKGTNILSFRSTRAMLNRNALVPLVNESRECKLTEKTNNEPRCHDKDPDRTFLETYNCDIGYPKPSWAQRAKKQIYRPSYVLSHFVHYSTVTAPMRTIPMTQFRYRENAPSEVFVDEENEATMVHAKKLGGEGTTDWKIKCHKDFVRPDRKSIHDCRMGHPFPKGITYTEEGKPTNEYTEDGYKKNCIEMEWLTDYWIPKLRKVLDRRKALEGE